MKTIIVREYLQSLTERDELDFLFPILLEVMGFKIISTAQNTKGLPQYGKDVIAIGTDKDGVRKRFYFELKGGADKDITTSTYNKDDGIKESINEAKDRIYRDSSNPEFNTLPVKIILVHNGDIAANVKETFDGFIEQTFPAVKKRGAGLTKKQHYEFERWDIFELTGLVTKYLFNEYLLTDTNTLNLFKKVLVLINAGEYNYKYFYQLLDNIFDKAGSYKSLGKRKRVLFFETLNMLAFIIHSYAEEASNLEISKQCLSHMALQLWKWILINKIENKKAVLQQFEKHLHVFYLALGSYFKKTLPVAILKNGLWSHMGGRYEKVGYPVRALSYLSFLIAYFELQRRLQPEIEWQEGQLYHLITILNNNDGGSRPILDNHSIPIVLVTQFLMENGKMDDARSYLANVTASIMKGYHTFQRLPDGSNRIDNVIRFVVTAKKSIYYQDKTSHLIGILTEHLALLGMKTEYKAFTAFIKKVEIDTAVFVPYTDEGLKTYLPETDATHELHLFSHTLYNEGYQSEIGLMDDMDAFREKFMNKNEFDYHYRTSNVGLTVLLTLAHVMYKTPFFPNYWRKSVVMK